MRVSLVSPYALAVPGGVQNQVIGLARVLERAGDTVQVLAPGDAAEDLPDDVRNVVVTTFGASVSVPANGSRSPVALSPFAVARGLRALSAFGPDVVHLHEPLAPAIGPAILAAAARRRRREARRGDQGASPVIVGTFHRAGAGLGYRTYGHVIAPLLSTLDMVFAVSEPARETLVKAAGARIGTRCALSFNGVDLSRFATARRIESDGRPVVCFAGRHEPRKGLATLLDAAPQFASNVQLWVIGEGPETASLRLRSTVDQRISWFGRVDDAELAARFGSATVVVAPSLGGESFGIVALEAMAAGTAVVASDLPGHRAAAGEAAAFFPPGDATALAARVNELVGDDDRRERLIAAGRKRAAARSFEALGAAYRLAYAGVLRR